MNDISQKQVATFIVKMVRSFPVALSVMFLVALIWAIDLSLRPYILKIILNRIAEPQSTSTFDLFFWPVTFYLFMSFLLSTVFRLYGYFVEIKMIPNLRAKIANVCMGKLLDQSHTYYQNNFSGSLASKVNDLTGSIPDIVQVVIDRFFSHILALAIAVYALWQVNIKFALAMLVWAFLFIILSLFLQKRLTRFADIWSEWAATITGRIVDALSNILSVRLFARKQAEKTFLGQTFGEAVKTEQKLQWSYFWLFFVYGYSFVILLGANLYFLIQGWQQGLISVGDFALVLAINTAIVEFLWQLTKDFSQFSRDLGKVTQALRTILVTPEIQDARGAKDLKISKGEIVFESVHFHYKGTQPLFHNKSVTIASGQKVGLVGYSGSGKTTFVNLILRLYDISSGHIFIDRQDVRQVTQDSLHSSIGMIPQDPSLFHRTMRENICYGKLDATDEEIIEAASKAHAHEFISNLPLKYDSLVGERGVKLSGGQRQRIAIARAILKNAPILILDEATSQLDSVTESYIQESLWELMQDKTTIVIAHRLSTLLHMDRILVFDQGKIVEDGNHQELLVRGGLYKILWDAQVGGFLPQHK